MIVQPGDLPTVGFIVPGIAGGFLMQTDTNSCIFEPFIANPESYGQDRDEALIQIMQDLLNAAKDKGYKRVFGFSTHPGMVSRALSLGFTIIENTSATVCKDIS